MTVKTRQFFVPADGETGPVAAELVEESLIEEVSIDGMCGVY
ncbi:mycofactocin precursor MftA [Nocardia shimofusensis]|nr:mycofactocin precursor MftA [Nocardia shimofusensis]